MMLRVPESPDHGQRACISTRNARTHADSPLALPSNSNDPDADWGPSAMDIRHRVFLMVNTPLPSTACARACRRSIRRRRPTRITTGLDDNGDTVFNDRPAGVGRNSARGASQWNVNLRLNRSFSLGGLLGDGPVMIGAPPPPPPPSSAAAGPRWCRRRRWPSADGHDGRSPAALPARSYVQVFNLFNTANLNGFVGNQLSPYFGTATSAAACPDASSWARR